MSYILDHFPELRDAYEEELDMFRKLPPEIDENDPLGWTKQLEIDEFVPPMPSFCAQLASFNHIVRDLLEQEGFETPRIKRLFWLIEEVLASTSDEDIQGQFEVCFFESLLNVDDTLLLTSNFVALLGPVSRFLCERNDAFWGCDIIGKAAKREPELSSS
ncbi:MAG: DUF7674 family protein [Alphaproteobacteria bacterium]